LDAHWTTLCSGKRIEVAFQVHPARCGFQRLSIAMNVGQIEDWGLSLPDGSRIHAWLMRDGRWIVHRDATGTVVAAALVGAGVGIALFQLLRAAFGSPQNAASAATTEASGMAPTARASADAVPDDDITTKNSAPPTAARSARPRSRLPPAQAASYRGSVVLHDGRRRVDARARCQAPS
jgi:hypothetical protein